MEFGSVCSGIEAASVAFAPLGWRAAWLAEIEPYPAAVLAHHYPDVPNLGDMTRVPAAVLAGDAAAPEVLCGGTPCQAFSVAGMREGLNDPRGQLTIKFVELADAIDHVRTRAGKPECITLWENVPGVLSDRGNAFGCFLGALAGEDCELQPPGGRWKDAGCVYGPQRTIAWRVLDAQYFGLAQRRRRVFVVASARNDFDPCAVLFESDSLRRDFAPSREQGQNTAGTLASRTTGGGFPGTDEACSGYLQPVQCFGGGRTSGGLDVAATLTAKGNRQDFEVETFAVHGTQDPDTARDIAHTLGRNNGQENAVFAIPHVDVMPTLRAGAPNGGKGHGARSGDSKDEYIVPVALSVALRGREGGATAELGDDVAGCLRASSGGGDKPHVLLAFDTTQVTSAANRSNPQPGNPCHPLAAGAHAPAIAYTTKLHNTKSNNAGKLFEERTPCLDAHSPAPALLTASQVRRLTPVECERLMGFPDGYTAIPWRGKPADQCPDGPRYKALGNSWAVPKPRWIAERIQNQLARK